MTGSNDCELAAMTRRGRDDIVGFGIEVTGVLYEVIWSHLKVPYLTCYRDIIMARVKPPKTSING